MKSRWFWTPTSIEDFMAIFPKDFRDYNEALGEAIACEAACKLRGRKANGPQVYRLPLPWRSYVLVGEGKDKPAVFAMGPPSTTYPKPPSFFRDGRQWWALNDPGDRREEVQAPAPPSPGRLLVAQEIRDLDRIKTELGMTAGEIETGLARLGLRAKWRNIAKGSRDVSPSEMELIKTLLRRLQALK